MSNINLTIQGEIIEIKKGTLSIWKKNINKVKLPCKIFFNELVTEQDIVQISNEFKKLTSLLSTGLGIKITHEQKFIYLYIDFNKENSSLLKVA